MTIKELLELGEPIFKQIRQASHDENISKALELLDSPQPDEWITPLLSEATGLTYYHNDIELIEGICDRVFDFWSYAIKGQPSIIPTKTGVIISVVIRVKYGWGNDEFRNDGIATEFVTNPKMLPLATPKCASMSFKNGIKKAGNLFGQSLNRNLEDAPIEPQDIFIEEKSDFQIKLAACNTIEDMAPLKKGLTPAQMKLWMDKLKEVTKKI